MSQEENMTKGPSGRSKELGKKIGWASVCLLIYLALYWGCTQEKPKKETDKAQSTKAQTKPVELDEKQLLLDTYYGDYRNCERVFKSGNIILQVWKPRYDHATSLSGVYQQTMTEGAKGLSIEYDEIWIKVNDDLFTPQEREEFKGQFDITLVLSEKGMVSKVYVLALTKTRSKS